MAINHSVAKLVLPFFINLEDSTYEIPQPDNQEVKIKTIAKLPGQTDERYSKYAKPNIVIMNDRYGRSRYTELEIWFSFNEEKYSQKDNQEVCWNIILPAINRLLDVIRFKRDAYYYLPRLSKKDILDVAFSTYFNGFSRYVGGLTITAGSTISSKGIEGTTPVTYPCEGIDEIKNSLLMNEIIPHSELLLSIAKDKMDLEDYFLSMFHLCLSLEIFLEEWMCQNLISMGISDSDIKQRLERFSKLTLNQKCISEEMENIIGNDLNSSPIKIEYQRIIKLRNNIAHTGLPEYEYTGKTYRIDNDSISKEHFEMVEKIQKYLKMNDEC